MNVEGGPYLKQKLFLQPYEQEKSHYLYTKIMSLNWQLEELGVLVQDCIWEVGVDDISLIAHLKLQSTPFFHVFGVSAIVIDSYLLDDIYGRYQGNEKFIIGTTGINLQCGGFWKKTVHPIHRQACNP